MGTCTTGCGSACPAFPGAASPSGTEVQEEWGRVPYGRQRDGADLPHVCRICMHSGLTCCTSGKHWSGYGCADRLSVAGRQPQRLSRGSGFKGGDGVTALQGASWWGAVFGKDKPQEK